MRRRRRCVCARVWSEVNAAGDARESAPAPSSYTVHSSRLLWSARLTDVVCTAGCRPYLISPTCVRACVSRHFAAVQSSAQPPYPPIAHVCTLVIAKFHYTDPTGHARTRTDFFAIRISEKLRWVRAGLRQSPCGSSRARVVEFSLYGLQLQAELLRSAAP